MKLSTFILDNIEPVLQEWEDFAKTIFPIKQMTNTVELRDHAKRMLMVIATDLDQKQSKLEQFVKSKGLQPQADINMTAAGLHGISRMDQGFSILQMVSEYRALRASVTKLFIQAFRKEQSTDLQDLVRFNEAIDQALCESIAQYSLAKEQQTRLFDSMLSSTPVLSYILDLDGSFLYVNKAMQILYNKPIYEIIGKAIYTFEMPTAAEVRESIQLVIKTEKQCSGEVFFKTPSGKECYFEYVYAPVFNESGGIEAIAGTSREITAQKTIEKNTWKIANYDFLTGLPNRYMFSDKLEQAIKRFKRTEEPFVLLFIDIDKFKKTNDQLGHEAGDLVLKKFAHRIQASLRGVDTVARLGGDEFTVIISDIQDLEKIKSVVNKLLLELRKPMKIKKNSIRISASIGITLCPQDSVQADDLLKTADQAMFVAKNEGGDQFKFHALT